MKEGLFIVLLTIFGLGQAQSQANIGIVTGYDLYQRYVNPVDMSGQDRSAGSVLLNTALGLKTWIGTPKMGISLEAYGNLGALGLNVEEYKGLGTFSFPILAKLNFIGQTGVGKVKKFGYYVGGGMQYNRTEWFGLTSDAKNKGVIREFYKTYVIELGIGSGNNEKITEFFVRFGFNGDMPSSNLNIGFNTSYSFVHRGWAKIPVPEEMEKEEEVIKM